MSFKSRDDLDRLLYAPEGEGDDGGAGDDGNGDDAGGGGKDGETDVSKVRATYDKQIAELNKTVKDLQDKLEKDDKDANLTAARQRALGEVQKQIKRMQDEDDDPERLRKTALEIIEGIGGYYADSAATNAHLQGVYKDTLAESLAQEIAFENGGSPATYKATLLKAKNEDLMRADALRLKAETRGQNGTGNSNGNSQRRPSPDSGRGSPSSRNLLDQMKGIDVTTPEGAKEWQEKRRSIARELEIESVG